ncbi:MAG: gephyrin-like molybdotransferase Glp [Chloroflexota bacterium]
MRPFGTLISFSEAQAAVAQATPEIEEAEQVSLDEAVGRVLAVDVVARLDHPPFDRSAMDGYALRARDTFSASRQAAKALRVVGTEHAGEVWEGRIGADDCLEIATGAVLPKGADAVVMVEDVAQEGDGITLTRPVYPGANVSRRGEDIAKGESLLSRGSLLGPAQMGALASQGMTAVEVYRQPRVAVFPSGGEVTPPGTRLRRGRVYDMNSYTVSALVKLSGGLALRQPTIPDSRQQIKSALLGALDNDFLVISGGSSVGERDLLADVLAELGEVLFHGVQIKPGKPTLFGRISGKPILGLPGYPTSCLTNAYLFLAPAVRKMARLPPRKQQVARARLGQNVSGSVGRRQFLTVRIEGDNAVVVFKEASSITSLSRADGYIEIPENIDLLRKGEEVEVKLLW